MPLTLSPTMAAQFLRSEHGVQHGRFYRAVERFLEGMHNAYARGLDFVLRHQRPTLYGFLPRQR